MDLGAPDQSASRKLRYEPVPVKDLLINMANLAELMVALAYYSVIYGDSKLASEVYTLEENVDYLVLQLLMHASLATRDAEDAESMLSIYRVALAADRISDAAADIAFIASQGLGPSAIVGRAIMEAEEMIARVKLRAGTELAGLSLSEVYERAGVVFDVIAIRRENRWTLSPDPGFVLREGDVLIVRGDEDAIAKLRELARDAAAQPQIVLPEEYSRIMKDVLKLKDTSELMVDLAYTSLLTASRELAQRVMELEEYVDKLYIDFERAVLSERRLSLDDKLALLRIATATENIADAATSIADIIVRGVRPHPLLSAVISESSERILLVELKKEATLDELDLEEHGGIPIAVRRGREWIIKPPPALKLHPGDLLIVRCYAEAEEQLERLLGDVGEILGREAEESAG